MEEEEKIIKGDDVVVELDATLEDLYMGGTLKVRPRLFTVLTLNTHINSIFRMCLCTTCHC